MQLEEKRHKEIKIFKDFQFGAAIIAAPFLLFFYQLFKYHHLFIYPVKIDVLLMSCIIFPVTEEIIFRGFIQEWIYKRDIGKKLILNISFANIITSIIFTSLHFIAHPPILAASVFIPSLVFGYFRDRHDSVIPSIVLHVWYNFVWFIVI